MFQVIVGSARTLAVKRGAKSKILHSTWETWVIVINNTIVVARHESIKNVGCPVDSKKCSSGPGLTPQRSERKPPKDVEEALSLLLSTLRFGRHRRFQTINEGITLPTWYRQRESGGAGYSTITGVLYFAVQGDI